jgi:hypothetical protein
MIKYALMGFTLKLVLEKKTVALSPGIIYIKQY